MQDDQDLDQRLVSWMSSGPNAAPREVIDRALVETTTVVQMPKRRDTSSLRSLVIGTMLALIVLVAVLIAVVWLGR